MDRLTFNEEVQNIIGCLEYWEKRVGEYVAELNENTLSEDESVMEDTQKALEFTRRLPEIIRSACVLACYAGEDWCNRQRAYNFGADGYEYTEKYVEGAMEIADDYGTEDFYDIFEKYFAEQIRPKDGE